MTKRYSLSEINEMQNIVKVFYTCESRHASRAKYSAYNVVVVVDGQIFSPDEVTTSSKLLEKRLRSLYREIFSRLVPKSKCVIAKLSGLHFRQEDVKKYLFSHSDRTNMVMHYSSWERDTDGTRRDDRFAIVEGPWDIIEDMYDTYWFALGFELRMEIFGMMVEIASDVCPELLYGEGVDVRRKTSILSSTSLVLDNRHNGFHFSIIVNDNCSDARGIHGAIEEEFERNGITKCSSLGIGI